MPPVAIFVSTVRDRAFKSEAARVEAAVIVFLASSAAGLFVVAVALVALAALLILLAPRLGRPGGGRRERARKAPSESGEERVRR